jgi:hypothetical protein
MQWLEVRQHYPNRWLIIEALEAHNTGDRRELDQLAVIEECADGSSCFRRYQDLHLRFPERDFYFVHTSRETLEILERQWLGIRLDHANQSQR